MLEDQIAIGLGCQLDVIVSFQLDLSLERFQVTFFEELLEVRVLEGLQGRKSAGATEFQ